MVNNNDFNSAINFWDNNIALAQAGPIKKLYVSDKSRNKSLSSKLMWCVKLIWDQESVFYNIPEIGPSNKIDLVFKDVYGDESYYKKNIEKITDIKNFYISLVDTVAKRNLRIISEKLEERIQCLAEAKYSIGAWDASGKLVGNTAIIIDKMLTDVKKITTAYEEAKKVVDNESKEEGRFRGGIQPSATDQGLI